jgi:hypothetical protein
MNHGKCPKCEGRIAALKVESLHAVVSSTEHYKALTMLCPHCYAVLGAALDPLALMNDTVAQIVDQIRVPTGEPTALAAAEVSG